MTPLRPSASLARPAQGRGVGVLQTWASRRRGKVSGRLSDQRQASVGCRGQPRVWDIALLGGRVWDLGHWTLGLALGLGLWVLAPAWHMCKLGMCCHEGHQFPSSQSYLRVDMLLWHSVLQFLLSEAPFQPYFSICSNAPVLLEVKNIEKLRFALVEACSASW